MGWDRNGHGGNMVVMNKLRSCPFAVINGPVLTSPTGTNFVVHHAMFGVGDCCCAAVTLIKSLHNNSLRSML